MDDRYLHEHFDTPQYCILLIVNLIFRTTGHHGHHFMHLFRVEAIICHLGQHCQHGSFFFCLPLPGATSLF